MMPSRYAHTYGAFELASMPGQPQVALCHGFFVHENERGHGHGHTLKATQRHILQALHYDYAVCTVSANNHAQKAILAQGGWQKLDEFHNHRLAETTELWGTKP